MEKHCLSEVLAHIEQCRLEYTKLPFFAFLQDNTQDDRERLLFARCMAHFVLSFADLNKYVFREEPTTDPLQDLINIQTHEEDDHWEWFLEDIEKLDLNTPMRFVDALKCLWSPATVETRRLSYRLSGLAMSADPVIKFAVIEAIEAISHAFFSTTLPITTTLQRATGKEYRYFGGYHLNKENEHTITNDPTIDYATIRLTAQQMQTALVAVGQVFAMFAEWTNELLRYSLEQTAV
jgi:hypothetical protein